MLLETLPDVIVAIIKALCDPQRARAVKFLLDRKLGISFLDRCWIVRQHYLISGRIASPHTTEEMLTVIREILTLPKDHEGHIVEAGSYKGSSSAKFSLAAKLAGRRLIICDSFRGLPFSDECHGMSIENKEVIFHEGDFAGSIEEVKTNIEKFGALDVCDFVEGWFDDSLVNWSTPIAVMYLDVDLASSTRSCLKYLYPCVIPGGSIYSQDGHLTLVIEVFEDREFWNREFGTEPPSVEGIRERKLIKLTKSSPALRVHPRR
jgi:O-methyltransferase